MAGNNKDIAKYNLLMTPEERSERARKAGLASKEARKQRKELKACLEAALSIETETGDYYTDITTALVKEALNGNTKAYELIRSTLGQDPKHALELSTADVIKIKIE